MAIDGVRHTLTSYHRTLSNVVLAEPASLLLSQVECPVSAIVGGDGRVCRPDHARRLAHDDPRLSLEILPGVDHHPALRVPRAGRPGGSWPWPAERSRTAQE